MSEPTPFLEANLFLAALEDDGVEMDRLIADLLPGEKQALLRACTKMRYRILATQKSKP